MNPHRSALFLVTQVLAQGILPIGFQVQVQGLQHLPEKGPVLLIPKHQQWWDVPLLGTFIPRPLFFLAKQELFSKRISRFYIRNLGGIAIDRTNPLRSLNTFRSLFPLLKRGSFLVLFPEGTYFRQTMGPGKWRLIRLIISLQQKQGLQPIPFVPVGIRYAPPTRWKKRAVEISLGPAMTETDPLQAEAFTRELLFQVKTLTRL